MPRPRSAIARGVLTFVAVLLATFALATLTASGAEASTPPVEPAPTTAPASGRPTATENVFMPERENVSDCFGGVERPNCGSKAKGGWRQGLVFAVIAGGMALIAWRLVVSVRKRDHAVNAS
jgi:hypothetical protein